MKNLPGWENTVFVANSGYGQNADRQKSEDAGFDHHLVKPTDLARISGLAKRSNADRSTGSPAPAASKP